MPQQLNSSGNWTRRRHEAWHNRTNIWHEITRLARRTKVPRNLCGERGMTRFEKIIVVALSLICLSFVGYIVSSWTSQGNPAVAAPSTPAAAAPVPARIVSDWQLNIGKDGFNDKKTCVISPLGKPHVQLNIGSFYITYRGRGGVSSYKYRIDDQPPSQTILATDIEKRIGTVHLYGSGFIDRLMRASRFRTSTFTVLSNFIEEDFDLAGLSNLYMKMRNEC